MLHYSSSSKNSKILSYDTFNAFFKARNCSIDTLCVSASIFTKHSRVVSQPDSCIYLANSATPKPDSNLIF